jgi:hypothetical protein
VRLKKVILPILAGLLIIPALALGACTQAPPNVNVTVNLPPQQAAQGSSAVGTATNWADQLMNIAVIGKVIDMIGGTSGTSGGGGGWHHGGH